MLEWLYKDMLTFFPEGVSTYSQQLDDMFAVIYWFSVIIFFLTYSLLFIFLVKYRYNPNRKAYHFHGSNLLEFTWTLLPSIVFVGIGLWSEDMWTATKYEWKVPQPDVQVDVMAYQFGWNVRYPGPDGQFGKKDRSQMEASNPFGIDKYDPAGYDDFVTMNQFHFPINKNIVVNLSTMDVLHSFFLPNFRVKQDAVPGIWIKVWFNGFKTGKYELACAELCGSGHYGMRGEVFMHSQLEYNKWLDEQYSAIKANLAANPPVPPEPKKAEEPKKSAHH
ncbi:MAG: cytochrome c oxidase subunit II [Ignavibacteria bacterium]|nr:cytochrome c oxidase subunit II [Ignavibacteria bacterium]